MVEVNKEEATTPNINLTSAQLDAIKKKAEEEGAKKAAEKLKLEAEMKAAKEEKERSQSTQEILNGQQWYQCIVHKPEGYDKVKQDVLSINNVKFIIKYDEPVLLPESAVRLLENSQTVVGTRTIEVEDEFGNKTKKVLPRYGIKRIVEKTPVDRKVK